MNHSILIALLFWPWIYGISPQISQIINLIKQQRGYAVHNILRVFDPKNDINEADDKGNTLLHWYVATHPVMPYFIDTFVQKGGNINAQNNDGNTPLLYALTHGKMKAALILLEKGAQKNIKNHNNENALHVFCKNGKFIQNFVNIFNKEESEEKKFALSQIKKFIISLGKDQTVESLESIIFKNILKSSNALQIISQLTISEFPINISGAIITGLRLGFFSIESIEDYFSPDLHFYTVLKNDICKTERSTKELLNAQDKSGNTPLHYLASNNANLELIKFFLSLGAHCLIENNQKNCPYQICPSPSTNLPTITNAKEYLEWPVYPLKYLTAKIKQGLKKQKDQS